MNHTYASLLDVLEVVHRGSGVSYMRDITSNVRKMKEWLVRRVGRDWASATVRNRVTKLGISSRGTLPWVEIRNSMTQPGSNSVPSVVSRHVRNLTKSFYAFS
jgi:hypothetical protein